MKFVLASNGGYPRFGDTPELQLLRSTFEAVARGEKTAADLADAHKEMTRRAIAEQAQAGIEVLTDGLIRWCDPVSHVAGALHGVRLGDAAPYFHTGASFRRPILVAPPARESNGSSGLVREFHFARNALGRLPTALERAGRLCIKPLLTGPYTLARLSHADCAAMRPLEARIGAFAEALAGEYRALIDAGAGVVQLDEPAVLDYPSDWDAFAAALRPLLDARDQARQAGREAKLALCVNLGDAAPLYERLIQLPVDALLLDFVSSATLADRVASAGAPGALGLGVVDGASPQIEDAVAIARQVERMLPKLGGGQVFLGPSCGLETLPRDRAYAKLELLASIRRSLGG